jgi:hypothetical protein
MRNPILLHISALSRVPYTKAIRLQVTVGYLAYFTSPMDSLPLLFYDVESIPVACIENAAFY